MFLNPESWNEVRRNDYNYPGMELPYNSMLEGNFIQRILYPDKENAVNNKNVPDGISLEIPLWWNSK